MPFLRQPRKDQRKPGCIPYLSFQRARTNGQFKRSKPQLQPQSRCGLNSGLFAGVETKIIMSTERQSKLRSGPPIVPADPATEREQLIAANQAFAAALKKALQSGADPSLFH
jgi:hypothetical protein